MSYAEKRSRFHMHMKVPRPLACSVMGGKETREGVVKSLNGGGVLLYSEHRLQSGLQLTINNKPEHGSKSCPQAQAEGLRCSNRPKGNRYDGACCLSKG
jgi:hypothetical protein